MLTVQDPVYIFNKQNIINYQRKLIQSPFQSLPKPTSRNQSKYSVCQLNNKVQQLINQAPHNLRWIGNGSNSPIQAYIYCLLMLSITNNKNFMMFKNVFYQLCRKYLDVKQQKLLIEFLCLLEFSSDKFLFLKKYPLIDHIIFSVFDKLKAEQNYYQDQSNQHTQQNSDTSRYTNSCRVSRNCQFQMQDSATGQLFQMNNLAELYTKFGTKFNFLKWSKSSQSSFVLTIEDNKKLYIIVQKQYFFILQLLQITEIKSPKSKLTKGDRIQVQRLLNSSQTQSQMSLHQKLNILSQNTQKNAQKFQQDSIKTKKTIDSDSNRKQILVCNGKNHTAIEVTNHFKKQFKFSYFMKKTTQKVDEVQESLIIPRSNQKKFDYIDLMESSFEEQRKQACQQQNNNNKKIQQSNSLKFYTPKFLMKPLNSPSQMKSKKKSFEAKANKTQIVIRERSPSEAQKKFIAICGGTGEKQKKQIKSKDLKFYSPPKIFKQSPAKNSAKKDQICQKNIHDIVVPKQKGKQQVHQSTVKQKRKDEVKFFDKRYYEKKEQIHNKHYNAIDNKTTNKDNLSKIATSISYNPKIFNNRISLQSRKDLDILSKYKIPSQDLMLNKIPQVDRSEQVSKRQIIQKKKIIRQELSQSLNNKSEHLLKKRLFQHLRTKFAGQNLTFFPPKQQKRNKSLEEKDPKQSLQKSRPLVPDFKKSKNSNSHRECPQNTNQNKLNGGFQIRIKLAESQNPLSAQ